MTGDSGLDILLFAFGILIVLSFMVMSNGNAKVEQIEREYENKNIQEKSIQEPKKQPLTEERFTDLMVFLLEINAISYNQYTEILSKATPYFKK